MTTTQSDPSMVEMEMEMGTNKDIIIDQDENNKKKKKSFIKLFKPDKNHDIEDIDDIDNLCEETIKQIVNCNAKEKLRPKIVRVAGTVVIMFLSILLAKWTDADFHVTKVLSISLAIMFVVYFGHVFYLFIYSQRTYRVYSLAYTIDKWTKMPITYRALLYKSNSIASISEYSAIGGGIANQMLLSLGLATSTTILVQEVNNLWFEKIWLSFTNNLLCDTCEIRTVQVFDRFVDDFFIFFGAYGLFILGIFELDPFSKVLPTLHYFGGLIGMGTVIGFTIQQVYIWRDKSIEPNYFGVFWCSFFCFTNVVSFFLWNICFSKKAKSFTKDVENNPDKYSEEEMHKQVRLNTIYQIVAEAIFLMSGAFSLCLWLWYFNELNPSFKSTHGGVLPGGGPWKIYFDFVVEKYKCDISELCYD